MSIPYRSGKKKGRVGVPHCGSAALVSTVGRGVAIGAAGLLRRWNVFGGRPREAESPFGTLVPRKIDDLRAPRRQGNEPVRHVLLPTGIPRFRGLYRFPIAGGARAGALALFCDAGKCQRPARNPSFCRTARSPSAPNPLLISFHLLL